MSRKTVARKSEGERLSVRVSGELGQRVEKIARQLGVSGSDVVRMALNSQLANLAAQNHKAA